VTRLVDVLCTEAVLSFLAMVTIALTFLFPLGLGFDIRGLR
jgi:hypothetical protein